MKPLFLLTLLLLPLAAQAYPLDGYPYTGIRRLEFYRLAKAGEIPGPVFVAGQYLGMEQIQPRWHASKGDVLSAPDAELGRKLGLMLEKAARPEYGIALLDLSDPQNPRYAVHNGDLQANVGSVGKILVALALFQKLADLYPNDIPARERVLRDTHLVADAFSQYDHHKVPFYDLEKKKRISRQIRIGDKATLWEFMDWMLSASSNSAAGVVQKELIALSHFGKRYPVSAEEEAAFFANTSYQELGRIQGEAMGSAVQRNGLDLQHFRQGSMFTREGNKRVASSGSSYATSEQLVKYLFRLEAGTLVDEFSSREIKRLLYMTQRRIRYASHPALNDAAVYFKSGSYFQCVDGPAHCKKYKGDKTNRLASVAIVESPAGAPRIHYAVAVMSNVLKVNSAVAHQTLAMRIHRLVEAQHPLPQAAPLPAETAYPKVPVDDTEDHDTKGDD